MGEMTEGRIAYRQLARLARNELPTALDAIEALEAENERLREQLAVLDEARSVEPYPVTIDDEAMNIRLTATVLVDHLPSQIVRRWALALIHTGLRILKTMDREVEAKKERA